MDFKVAVILILASISRFEVLQEQVHPGCTGREIEFIVNPRNETVPCRANMTAQFPCRYQDSGGSEGHSILWWTINTTLYGPSESDKIPNHIYNLSEKIIYSNNITISQNNSAYVCEFHTIENGSRCAYRSTPGYLIIAPCKVIGIRYVAYYRFEDKSVPSPLEEIMVFFSHQDIFVNSVINYTTVFSDSDSGDNLTTCYITSSDCNHELCNCSFKMGQRNHSSTGINVTVLANDSRDQIQFLGSDPIKIDVVNKLFNVSLDEDDSMLVFMFHSIANQSETICSVASGPHTANCRNSELSEPTVSTQTGDNLTDSRSVAIDISFLGSTTKFCFVANASMYTGIKTVVMSGIYDTASTTGIHCVSSVGILMMSILPLLLYFYIFIN